MLLSSFLRTPAEVGATVLGPELVLDLSGTPLGTFVPVSGLAELLGVTLMQAAIDRILSTYRMMRNLSENEIKALRADLVFF